MGMLDGTRIVVVGADGPLGAAAVEAFVAEGARVGVVEVGPDGDATEGVDRAVAELSGIDVLANLTKPAPPPTAALAVERAQFESVVTACIRTARTSNQAAYRHMTANGGGGHVINVADAAAEFGIPGMSLVGAAAQAVVAWSRAAANAWTATGVRVNIVQPSLMSDPRSQAAPVLVFLASGHGRSHGLTFPC